jgi:hypothetical protein
MAELGMAVGELAIRQYSVRMYAGSTGTMIGCGGDGVGEVVRWVRERESRARRVALDGEGGGG